MRVVLLLLPSLNVFSQQVLEHLYAESGLDIVGAVIDCTPEESLQHKLKKNLAQGRGGYVLIMALNKLFGSRTQQMDTKQFMTQRQIPVLEIDNPYTPASLDQIRDFKADVGVLISAFGIVKSSLIKSFDKGILSYHHGDMRHYRGQPPAFWELFHDEKMIGVTVQRINRKLDRGEIILEQPFSIDRWDTLTSLESKIFRGSVSMMTDALMTIKQPHFQGLFLDQFGPIYTLPNLRQWLRFQYKMFKKRVLNRNLKDR